MKTVLKIEGMSCEHCAAHVKEALEEIPGVVSAEVSLKEKSAAVEHKEGIAEAALKAAVNEAGYEAL